MEEHSLMYKIWIVSLLCFELFVRVCSMLLGSWIFGKTNDVWQTLIRYIYIYMKHVGRWLESHTIIYREVVECWMLSAFATHHAPSDSERRNRSFDLEIFITGFGTMSVPKDEKHGEIMKPSNFFNSTLFSQCHTFGLKFLPGCKSARVHSLPGRPRRKHPTLSRNGDNHSRLLTREESYTMPQLKPWRKFTSSV